METEDEWHKTLKRIITLPSEERYDELLKLHDVVVHDYLKQLDAITDEQAREQASSTDKRSVASVVGHILAWEEWMLEIFDDPNPTERLKKNLNMQGYVDPETQETKSFKDVDDFNAYQDTKYSSWSWENVHKKAEATALKLQKLFADKKSREFIYFLDSTPSQNEDPFGWNLPHGWFLWAISLEHEAVGHKKELTRG